jgi:hypothetical protein
MNRSAHSRTCVRQRKIEHGGVLACISYARAHRIERGLSYLPSLLGSALRSWMVGYAYLGSQQPGPALRRTPPVSIFSCALLHMGRCSQCRCSTTVAVHGLSRWPAKLQLPGLNSRFIFTIYMRQDSCALVRDECTVGSSNLLPVLAKRSLAQPILYGNPSQCTV